MTPTRKPPTGPPPSAGVLAKYAQAYAREAGVSEGRVRAWLSYMILAGVLERAAGGGDPRFSLKGGVALELRLRDRARATKDIDVVLQHTDADLARTLERALTGDAYQGFTFRRKGEPLLLENGTVNMEFAVNRLEHIAATANAAIGRGCVPGTKPEQRLESGHGLVAAIVSKDELVQVDLKLRTADTVIRADQPMLEIPDRAVRQRHD